MSLHYTGECFPSFLLKWIGVELSDHLLTTPLKLCNHVGMQKWVLMCRCTWSTLFRRPYLRFNSNKREGSRSLHLHFSPSYWLPHFNCRISSPVILIPGLKKKKTWPCPLPRNSFIMFVPQSFSKFMLSLLSLLSNSRPPYLLLQTVEPLYELININEWSMWTCSCTTKTLCVCVCACGYSRLRK